MYLSKLRKSSYSFIKVCISIVCLCLCVPSTLSANDNEMKFGVLSLAPPSKIYKNWKPFADYLSKESGMSIKIVAPRGFGKLKKMAENKKVDIFYINSHIFYKLKKSAKAVPIAQMENISNSITSQSDIFVRGDSNINTISDLKGKTIAFVSPMGAGGYLAPRAYLYEQGLSSKDETTEKFTKNLTNSIYDILLGKADAATMCGVNYQLMSKKIDTGELKVIASSGQYPENVLAARSDIANDRIKQLIEIIVNMPNKKDGRSVLEKMKQMKIKRFVEYDAKVEALTKKLLQTGRFEK